MKRGNNSLLGAERLNGLVGEIAEWYAGRRDYYIKELMSSGYPPFTAPTTPRDQYDILSALRASGDPRYWQNPQAQRELAALVTQFGPPQGGQAPAPVRFDLPTPQIPLVGV